MKIVLAFLILLSIVVLWKQIKHIHTLDKEQDRRKSEIPFLEIEYEVTYIHTDEIL